jgi:integrase
VLQWNDLEHGVINIVRAYNRRKPGEMGERRARRRAASPSSPTCDPCSTHCAGRARVRGWSSTSRASERVIARNFRRWLWKANVRRPALHEGTPTSKNITWHDLRATGATWMAVRGDDPLKIKQRCGHASFATTEIYIRKPESVREGFGEVFPALPSELLEPIGGGLEEVWQNPNSPALDIGNAYVFCGVDGTRTRGLRRDRPAL